MQQNFNIKEEALKMTSNTLLEWLNSRFKDYKSGTKARVEFNQTLGRRWGIQWQNLRAFMEGRYVPQARVLRSISHDTDISMETLMKHADLFGILKKGEITLHGDLHGAEEGFPIEIRIHPYAHRIYSDGDFTAEGIWLRAVPGQILSHTLRTGLQVPPLGDGYAYDITDMKKGFGGPLLNGEQLTVQLYEGENITNFSFKYGQRIGKLVVWKMLPTRCEVFKIPASVRGIQAIKEVTW